MSYRGHVENGVVVLDEPFCLPEGAQVEIEARQDAVEHALQLALDVYAGLSSEKIAEIEMITLQIGKILPDNGLQRGDRKMRSQVVARVDLDNMRREPSENAGKVGYT